MKNMPEEHIKFAMSYSCGKDSALALHRMKELGHKPVALIITVNEEQCRSWFHGVDDELMDCISKALDIPLIKSRSKGEDYTEKLEQAMKSAKDMGAEAVVFGDIDIDDHFKWCSDRCENVGLKAVFPLWGEKRDALVQESIELKYSSYIKCIRKDVLSTDILGKRLTKETIDEIINSGVDACGENGEYHTLVIDGPIFKSKVDVVLESIIEWEKHAAIDIKANVSKEN